jgi:RHS repeat-associated protein
MTLHSDIPRVANFAQNGGPHHVHPRVQPAMEYPRQRFGVFPLQRHSNQFLAKLQYSVIDGSVHFRKLGCLVAAALVALIVGNNARAGSTCWVWVLGGAQGTAAQVCMSRDNTTDNGEVTGANGQLEEWTTTRTYTPSAGTSPLPEQGAQSAGYCDLYENDSILGTATATQFYNLTPSNVPCPSYCVSAVPQPLAEVCTDNCVKDPINPAKGNVYATETDVKFSGPGRVGFSRFFNSADSGGSDFVPGWRHSYSRSVSTVSNAPSYGYTGQSTVVSPQYTTPAAACTTGFGTIQSAVNTWTSATATYSNGVCVLSKDSTTIGTLPIQSYPISEPLTGGPLEYDVIRDDGQTLRYTLQNGVINNPPGISIRLAMTGSGFTVTDDDDNVEVYNSTGVLQSITSRAGVVQTISYDGSGFFHSAVDSFGGSVTVTRNAHSQIGSVAVNGGGTVQYGYDSVGRLSTVTNLDGTSRTYVYGFTGLPNAITSIVDESGTTYSSWGYDTQGRAASTQEAGGANATGLVYNSNGSVTVTDALGAVRTFSYMRSGDISKVTSISGSQCPTCQESAATNYDSAGWVASRTDYDGNLTCYANDPLRGLELVRVEGFAPSSTCPSSLSSYTPASGTLQRKITTAWSATWREPSLITEPNRTTGFTFDGSGNILTETVTDTSVSPNVSRIWTYTYNSFGRVLTVVGPRTDVLDKTILTYYTCTTGNQCGQIDTITNAVGQVTTFNTYNAYGQPLTITDPNGILTTLTYDARERLTSSQVGTETTTYSYWPIGLVKLVTLPDSSTIQLTYDGAHRLTTITDGNGNYISYTLDALGNRTAESSYDPSATLHRTHTRVFNSLSQLYQDINSAGTAAVTTTLGYDSQGNLTSSNAPLSRKTGNQFDALNRLDQITDPNNGITKISYDANDNLAAIIDPRAFTTSYTHNGFNDVTKMVSPDTGTASKTFDSGGNLKTTTDARGAVATYTYDAMNRETQVAYTDQTIHFGYDAGANGKGRLTSASDANHSMSWTYDTLGRVTGKGQTVAGVTKSVGYTYTNGDLTSLVTPSGQAISYTYTNHRINSIKVGSTTLLSGVTYDPFGPPTAWTWGNSSTVSRAYDEDGNPHQIVTAAVTNGYTVDAASRITSITDSGLSTATWNFTSYDVLDRIKAASSSAKSRGYTYDANSNRLTTTGSTASTETIATSSNHLSSTSGGIVRTYGYDAAGNTTSYTGETFTFNQRGRMSTATSSSATSYIYNALGQLIEKSGNGGTTLLVYDEAGHLEGEYSSTGALIQETVWMGDMPVATLRPNGSTVTIYYVHTDHLGTPRKITNPTGNAVVWRWDPDTFGSVAPSITTLSYNLRFPGQYFLPESGLHYNYFRMYDPQMGRYLESDPIGLQGGINTYAYANGNPISLSDPLGLCADRQRCAQLRQNINNKSQALAKELAKYNPAQDALGGFPMRYGSGFTKPGGHYTEIQNLQRGLAKDINKYEELNCDEDDDQGPGFGAIAHSTLDMATQYVQPPQFPQINAPSISNQTLYDAVLSALLAAAAAVALSPQ